MKLGPSPGQRWRCDMRRLVSVALIAIVASMLGSGIAGGAAPAKAFPKNACKLLTASEVKALIPDADAGTKKNEGVQGVKNASCYWKSVSGTNLASLNVTVLSLGSSVPPGFAKLALQHETGAKKVSGIGSYAIYTSVINVDLNVKAVVGKLTLDVDYNANSAQDQKGAVIKIAKAVAKRI